MIATRSAISAAHLTGQFLPASRPARLPSLQTELDRFMTQLSLAVVRARAEGRSSQALLTIDLDRFTSIQGSLGADAVRGLLDDVGGRLRSQLGPDDHMARVGRDVFLVLVGCGCDSADAWRVAERMLAQFTPPFPMGRRPVAITASVGVAPVHAKHGTAADVIRDGYAAVHGAMSTGGARCVLFDDGMHEATIEQLRLAADLRHAVDRAEFRLYYQPIVDCGTGAVRSLEALIRWEHPTRGCLPPSAFLDALVRGGLMSHVGRWVVAEAARQSVEWHRSSVLHSSIAVNVSPTQLSEPGFVDAVRAIVRASGARPEWLSFEMTEDAELANGESALQALRELREAGFRVRIDDFGTGYSSLSYLQRLPIDGLKIDRAFIDQLERDTRRREIVSAIIRLAHVLDLDVVAEGVERPEQLELLRALGCDLVQGFFMSPPLAAVEAKRWLALRS